MATSRLLAWMAEHTTSITTTTQANLEHYAVEYPGRGKSGEPSWPEPGAPD